MDKVFQALAHPARRRMLDIIQATPGMPVKEVAASFDVSRVAVMKHLAILEAANLIVSRRAGRQRFLYFNLVPIQMIYERWGDAYGALWASGLTSLKATLEQQ